MIADAGTGLRAGQSIAWPDTPCHGDIFHIQQQVETMVTIRTRRAGDATSECERLDARLANPRQRCDDRVLLADFARLRQLKPRPTSEPPIFKPSPAGTVDELRQREHADLSHIGTLRLALYNQRDDLLAFAGVLDLKLTVIAHDSTVPEHLVRAACLLHRKPTTSGAFWRARSELYHAMGHKFYSAYNAVSQAMRSTPRSSSLVGNLN